MHDETGSSRAARMKKSSGHVRAKPPPRMHHWRRRVDAASHLPCGRWTCGRGSRADSETRPSGTNSTPAGSGSLAGQPQGALLFLFLLLQPTGPLLCTSSGGALLEGSEGRGHENRRPCSIGESWAPGGALAPPTVPVYHCLPWLELGHAPGSFKLQCLLRVPSQGENTKSPVLRRRSCALDRATAGPGVFYRQATRRKHAVETFKNKRNNPYTYRRILPCPSAAWRNLTPGDKTEHGVTGC